MTTNEVGKLYLPWLVKNADPHGHSRRTTSYLDESPTLGGEPITEAQLGRVLDRAESLGMVKLFGSWGETVPHDARILPRAHQCVEEYGGDMSRFEQALTGASTTTQTMNVHQRDGGNVTGFTGGGDVAQANRVEAAGDPERIRAGADAVEELLRLYPGAQNRAEIEGAVEDARKAAADGDDDARASASSRLVTTITTMAGVSTLARFVIDWLGGPGALG